MRLQINLSHFVLACFSETIKEVKKLFKEAKKQMKEPKPSANAKSDGSPVKTDVEKEAEKKVSKNQSSLLKSSLSDLKENSVVQDKFYTPHPGVDCASRVKR